MNVQLRSPHQRQSRRPRYEREFGDFRCAVCGSYVSTSPALSGVQNRNHCPYCLASRHVDMQCPGDRLSACKAIMHPLGLALKRVHKKYAAPDSGELMLIHRCSECGKLSLNRIAADDDSQAILGVFETTLDHRTRALIDSQQAAGQQITPLTRADQTLVRKRLLGC